MFMLSPAFSFRKEDVMLRCLSKGSVSGTVGASLALGLQCIGEKSSLKGTYYRRST